MLLVLGCVALLAGSGSGGGYLRLIRYSAEGQALWPGLFFKFIADIHVVL